MSNHYFLVLQSLKQRPGKSLVNQNNLPSQFNEASTVKIKTEQNLYKSKTIEKLQISFLKYICMFADFVMILIKFTNDGYLFDFVHH